MKQQFNSVANRTNIFVALFFTLIETMILFYYLVMVTYRYPAFYDWQLPLAGLGLLVFFGIGFVLFRALRLRWYFKIGIVLVIAFLSFWLGWNIVSSCCSVA